MCARRKLLFTLRGIDPGPLEADERIPSRCTTFAPFPVHAKFYPIITKIYHNGKFAPVGRETLQITA